MFLKFFEDVLSTFYLFLLKENKFWTFWEPFNKNIIRDTFFKNLPKLAIFEKIKLFFQKKHLFSPKNQNFERFQNSEALIQLYTHFKKFLESLSIEKSWKTFLKNPNSKHFEKSWVKAQFETDLISNLPSYLISKNKSSFFSEKPTCFSKKNQSLNFLRIFWAKIPFETHSKEI